MMAFYIWGNTPTVMGVLGIFTVLGGSLLYTLVKMNEGRKAAAAPPPQQQVDEEKVEMIPKQQPQQV